MEIVEFPRNPSKEYKTTAYADCYRKHKGEYDWIAFLDADDYIVLVKDASITDLF